MSCNSNSGIVDCPVAAETAVNADRRLAAARSREVFRPDRRRLLLGLSAWPLLCFANPAPYPGLKRWGSGQYRRFGFLVYEATLWAADNPEAPPLALRLDYKRSLRGQAIAEASIQEMRRFGADAPTLERWGQRLRGLFPDVKEGDHITGLYQPERALFLLNDQPLGEVSEPEFAKNFFAIWLDPRTSAPALRAALLGRGD